MGKTDKKSDTRASVGVAIIAKNSEKTIGDCLVSIVPFVKQVVVCVDQDSTDATARVAKRYGASRVYRGFVVSEEHECPEHGKVMAQHFAKARQKSFEYLDKSLDWHMWIDADDIVKGADRLREYLETIPPQVAGVWLPYHYAKAGGSMGPTSTLFDRERIVRSNLPWQWQSRVHETLTPVGATTESLLWTRTELVSIHHQSDGHDTAGSARRNILLLEIDLEENPNDLRAWYYLGNQYFALAEWDTAARCYEKATQSDNPYQLWQTFIYLSMAYEKLGNPRIEELPLDLQGAILENLGKVRASVAPAWLALDVQPSHPEPWYRLAANAMMLGDVGRTEFYTDIADKRPDAPLFVFKNPLDRTFNKWLLLAQAYASDGQTTKAKKALQMAANTIPTPEVLKGIEEQSQLESDAVTAEAYLRILSSNPNPYISSNIPDNVWKFGRVRDQIVPSMLASLPKSSPRIIFFCGKSLEPWAPPSIDSTGIGGSETAVIQIAKRFAQDGWRVDVYNDCDPYEGIYEGVGYWDLRRLQQGEQTDVLVSWRNPQVIDIPIEYKVSILWCHDLNRGGNAGEYMARWKKVLGVSAWHKDYMRLVYGLDNVDYVPNGIDLGKFQPGVEKVPFRCVYGSSQDRGLLLLLMLWPQILAQEPQAELHIAYGWEGFDKSIALGARDLAVLKNQILRQLEQTERVVWRGRLNQVDLAKLYQESYCWLYPTQFTEVSCITAMEAMAGGAVPVTSAVGALVETIGESGIVVTGNTYSKAWKDFWVQCAKAALLSPQTRLPLVEKGIERSKEFTWDNSYKLYWKPIIEHLMRETK